MTLHANASARTLGMMRAWVYGLWALFLALEPLASLAEMPRCAFAAPGILRGMPGLEALLEPAPLTILRVAIIVACALAALGVRARAAGAIAALLLVVEQGLLRGFGHVNHAELPLLWAAMLLPLFPCADAFAKKPDKPDAPQGTGYAAGAVTIVAMFLATYALAGLNRLVDAPEVLVTDAVRTWTLESSYLDPWPWSPRTRALSATPAAAMIGALGMVVVTALEIAAPLALFSRRFRTAFVAVMLVFHVATAVFMNIVFLETMLLLPLLYGSYGEISTRAPTPSAP